MHAYHSALTIGGILGEEWTKDAALSRIPHHRVVECINESRNTKNVRQENELLANGCASVAHACQELNCIHPFLCSEAEWIQRSVRADALTEMKFVEHVLGLGYEFV
jgi:hypothetical protein